MGSFLSKCCYESENELNLNETYTDFQSDLDPVTKGNIIWYTELQDVNYNIEAGEVSQLPKMTIICPNIELSFNPRVAVKISFVDISFLWIKIPSKMFKTYSTFK